MSTDVDERVPPVRRRLCSGPVSSGRFDRRGSPGWTIKCMITGFRLPIRCRALIPVATGACDPSMTITAIAERAMDTISAEDTGTVI